MTAPTVLSADALSIGYATDAGLRRVVEDVSVALATGRILGLAGESGCGKSTLALALAGYRAPGARVLGGLVELEGFNLLEASVRQLRRVWGAQIAYLPQDTATALNPARRIAHQLTEPLAIHHGVRRRAARSAAVQLLARVGLADPEHALTRFPHQFSGGQQQRIALAMALISRPKVLVLDEPTTGLDVTTQARINALIRDVVDQFGVAVLYVSHDLSLLATLCDELAIMYAGQIVERGAARTTYLHPRHPYTRGLIGAVPVIELDRLPRGMPGRPPLGVVEGSCAFLERCDRARADVCDRPIELRTVGGSLVRCARVDEGSDRGAARPRQPYAPAGARPRATGTVPAARHVLVSERLRKEFRHRGHVVTAVDGVSVRIDSGRTLGIAGESGSGKSTLLRLLSGLIAPTDGHVLVDGRRLAATAGARTREDRRAVQIVFQNPDASLNPRQRIGTILARPISMFRPGAGARERRDIAATTLESLQLDARILDRYPGQLSGGERQRVALARALVAEPSVILCDEITSALDVSVQASILELLVELKATTSLSLVFVSHDLGVLRSIADDLVIMERGCVRESGSAAEVLSNPRHEYTQLLLAAVPRPAHQYASGAGDVVTSHDRPAERVRIRRTT